MPRKSNNLSGRVLGKKTKEYIAWDRMKSRCCNKKNARYKDYGGRGIKVCERWMIFENFFVDMGCAPTKFHQLDRFPNNDGDYEPNNCRWATAIENNNNRRNNLYVDHNGIKKTIRQLSNETGLPYKLISDRLKRKWSVENAIKK